MQNIHAETQVFKNNEPPFGSKKTVLILALVIFVVTVAVATYYGRLITPTNQRQSDSDVVFVKSETNADFTAKAQLTQSEHGSPEIAVLDNIVPDKTNLSDEAEKIIFVGETGINVTTDQTIAPNWSLLAEGDISSVAVSGQTLLISTTQSFSEACPITLATLREVNVSIPCTDIYINNRAGANTIYSVLAVNALEGNLINKVSFLGGAADTQVYLSEAGAVIAQNMTASGSGSLYDFFLEKGPEFMPPQLIIKIQRLEAYDLSEEAKVREMEVVVKKHYDSLSGRGKSEFMEKYVTLLSEFLGRGTSISNSVAAVFTPELTEKHTFQMAGHVARGAIHQSRGEHYALTVEKVPGTSNYASAVLYKLGESEKYDLAGYPEAFQFTDGWLFVSQYQAVSALKLDGFAFYPIDVSEKPIIASFQDHFVFFYPDGETTKTVFYAVEESLSMKSSFSFSHPWNEVLSRVDAFSKSAEGLLYMSGLSQDFILSSSQERVAIFATVVSTNSSSSYFDSNHLYFLGDNVYIMDLDTREIRQYSVAGR